MHPDVVRYNQQQEQQHQQLCDVLAAQIDTALPDADNKIWHAHPVWFIDGNPIVGYSRQTRGIRLMFWSGADFGEERLNVVGRKFRDASVYFNDAAEVNSADLRRWLAKAQEIQWNYKDIVKHKGRLDRLK